MLRRQFESVTDLHHHLLTSATAKGAAQSSVKGSISFTGGVGYGEALDLLCGRAVWGEGVSRMVDSAERLDTLLGGATPPRIVRSVVGGSPSVGAAVTGHPRNMRRPRPAFGRGVRPITLALPLGYAAALNESDVILNGAALMHFAELLSRTGNPVTVVGVWRGFRDRKSILKKLGGMSLEVMLHAPPARLDAASLAFALAHPAMLRRVLFAVVEKQKELAPLTHAAYGQAVFDQEWWGSMQSDFDLIAPPPIRVQNIEEAWERVWKSLSDQCDMIRTAHHG